MAEPKIETFVYGDVASPANMQDAQSSYLVAPQMENVRSAVFAELADPSGVATSRSKALKLPLELGIAEGGQCRLRALRPPSGTVISVRRLGAAY
jgi:hypothetical protein